MPSLYLEKDSESFSPAPKMLLKVRAATITIAKNFMVFPVLSRRKTNARMRTRQASQ